MIFYFSATGNSLQVAGAIAEAQQEKLISIADCLKNNQYEFTPENNEKIGFIFPVYFYGLPSILYDFIERLKLHNYHSQYTFAVCTCGNGPGNALQELQKAIKRKSIKLNYGSTILLPDNYILLFNLLPPVEKQKEMFDSALLQIEEVNRGITDNTKGISELNQQSFPVTRKLFTYPLYQMTRTTKNFHVTNACTGCGLCERICPSQAIRLENSSPVWHKKKCTQCLGCLHRCPVRAIEWGAKTQKRGRYVNPNCRLPRT